MTDPNAFQAAWAMHENAERFSRTMRDLAQATPDADAEKRAQIAVGLLQIPVPDRIAAAAALKEKRDLHVQAAIEEMRITWLRIFDEEAERRARLREIVCEALAENAGPVVWPPMSTGPFLRPDYMPAPVNDGPIALMRRG